MSNREVIEWLKKKAEVVTMPGARKMYKAAAKALEAQNVVEKALDEYEYNGKTLREWIEIISASALSTNLAEVGADCISRQAAIEALTEYRHGRAVYISVGEAIIRIEQLPPAQPEQLEQCPIYGGICAYPSDQCYDCPRHAGAKMEVTT